MDTKRSVQLLKFYINQIKFYKKFTRNVVEEEWYKIFEDAFEHVYVEEITSFMLSEIVKVLLRHNLEIGNEETFIENEREKIMKFCTREFKNTWNSYALQNDKKLLKDEIISIFYKELKSAFEKQLSKIMKIYIKETKLSNNKRYGRYVMKKQRALPTFLKKFLQEPRCEKHIRKNSAFSRIQESQILK